MRRRFTCLSPIQTIVRVYRFLFCNFYFMIS